MRNVLKAGAVTFALMTASTLVAVVEQPKPSLREQLITDQRAGQYRLIMYDGPGKRSQFMNIDLMNRSVDRRIREETEDLPFEYYSLTSQLPIPAQLITAEAKNIVECRVGRRRFLVYEVPPGETYMWDDTSKTARKLASGENPRCSPNGEWLWYSRQEQDRRRYFVVRTADGKEQFDFKVAHCDTPRWSPDSKYIAYSTYTGELWGLFRNCPDTYRVFVRRVSDGQEDRVADDCKPCKGIDWAKAKPHPR